jgi:hypothetical protein
VTRREILHQVLSVGSFDMNRVPSRARGHIEGPRFRARTEVHFRPSPTVGAIAANSYRFVAQRARLFD